MTSFHGVGVSPAAARAQNFAFDVTPHDLVAAIITEVGVLEPPYAESIRAAFEQAIYAEAAQDPAFQADNEAVLRDFAALDAEAYREIG